MDLETHALPDERGAVCAELLLDKDFFGFAGHFPNHPICPAILEVGAVVRALSRALGREVELFALDGAKFLKPAGPGETLTLRCEPRGENRYEARIDSAGAPVARFTLTVRDKAP